MIMAAWVYSEQFICSFYVKLFHVLEIVQKYRL